MNDLAGLIARRVDIPMRCELEQYRNLFDNHCYLEKIRHPGTADCGGCGMKLIYDEDYEHFEICASCADAYCDFECEVCNTHHNCAEKHLVLRWHRDDTDSCCQKCYADCDRRN